jgi:hypothetical protein
MTQTLLNLFPWVDPNNTKDFSTGPNSVHLVVGDHDPFIVALEPNTQKGLLHYPGGQNWTHEFSTNSLADAVGLVSHILPEWLKDPSFRKPVFRLVGHYRTRPQALFSPSGNAFRVVRSFDMGNKQVFCAYSDWKPIEEFYKHFWNAPHDMVESDMEPSDAGPDKPKGSIVWMLSPHEISF